MKRTSRVLSKKKKRDCWGVFMWQLGASEESLLTIEVRRDHLVNQVQSFLQCRNPN